MKASARMIAFVKTLPANVRRSAKTQAEVAFHNTFNTSMEVGYSKRISYQHAEDAAYAELRYLFG